MYSLINIPYISVFVLLPLQLDALCPAVDELMKLTAAPPGGQMAVLQAAVQVHLHAFTVRLPAECVHIFPERPFLLPFFPLSSQEAASGAESTRNLTARAGRASYIAAERVTLPDPGAVAVAAIFKAVLESLEGQK